jgi:nicotinate-nucleotide adenylyltransferase
VAFFGGSFDPPHLGHLAVARAARDALQLDCVLFAPVGAQPLKPHGSTAPFADRLAMTALAISGEPGFEISLADAPTSDQRPNYTLETLGTIRAGLPPGGSLFCLMGADSFVSLSHWHGAAELPFVASLIVASRPGQQLDDLARFLPRGLTLEPGTSHLSPPSAPVELRSYLIRNPAGQIAPFYLLPNLDVEISASEIRKQVHLSAQDLIAARPLLPPPVADYIRTHSLYR